MQFLKFVEEAFSVEVSSIQFITVTGTKKNPKGELISVKDGNVLVLNFNPEKINAIHEGIKILQFDPKIGYVVIR